jgi:CDP-diacylglycerol--serine O-phosphatidyltransferase
MKNLPNIITLGNLFFGCCAISFILTSHPYLSSFGGEEYWVLGTEQFMWGALCIVLAAVCDFLDGLVARAMGVSGPLGIQLDSLADVVSFGVAPAMILYKMLWGAWMREPHALDVPIHLSAPAFLLACFAAMRLAKFNISTEQKTYFRGMPTPAIGLVVASLVPIQFYNLGGVAGLLQQWWVLYLIVALLSWLMVSPLRFFSFKFSGKGFKGNEMRYIFIALSIVLLATLQYLAIPVIFAAYIVFSIFYKYE